MEGKIRYRIQEVFVASNRQEREKNLEKLLEEYLRSVKKEIQESWVWK